MIDYYRYNKESAQCRQRGCEPEKRSSLIAVIAVEIIVDAREVRYDYKDKSYYYDGTYGYETLPAGHVRLKIKSSEEP